MRPSFATGSSSIKGEGDPARDDGGVGAGVGWDAHLWRCAVGRSRFVPIPPKIIVLGCVKPDVCKNPATRIFA